MLTQKQVDGLRTAPAVHTGHSGTNYHLLSETENAALCDTAETLLALEWAQTQKCDSCWLHVDCYDDGDKHSTPMWCWQGLTKHTAEWLAAYREHMAPDSKK